MYFTQTRPSATGLRCLSDLNYTPPMKTTPTEDFKNVWMAIKGLESELRAYELAFAALKQTLTEQGYTDFSHVADVSLSAARQSPPLVEKMRKQYDEVWEKYFQPGVEVLSPEEVLKLLQAPLITKKIQ